MRSSFFAGVAWSFGRELSKLARVTSRESFQTKRFSKCAICANLRFGARAAVCGVRRVRRSHSVVLDLDGDAPLDHAPSHGTATKLSADLCSLGVLSGPDMTANILSCLILSKQHT